MDRKSCWALVTFAIINESVDVKMNVDEAIAYIRQFAQEGLIDADGQLTAKGRQVAIDSVREFVSS